MSPSATTLPGVLPEPPRGRAALRHPILWLRTHPMVADTLLASFVGLLPLVTWAVGFETEPDVAWRRPDIGFAACALLNSVPLVWRRRRPLPVLAATLLAAVIVGVRTYSPDFILVGDVIALYSVATHASRKASRRTLVAYCLLVPPALALVPTPPGHSTDWGEIVAAALLYLTAWSIGDNLRTRRANVVALHDRAIRAEHDREAEALRAVEAERTRIAREMHDVVAHSMSVMVVQAGGARRMVRHDPDRAEQALTLVESTGREALTEMRRLLGVLREGDQGHDRAPQPSLERLDELVAECEAAGVAVELKREGQVRPLAPGVDLAAYRIVQEALTNVRRHAGPARAEVTVTYAADEVRLEVADDGRGLGADSIDEQGIPGHGLVGMTERAALYGGSVTARPRSGGGFVVTADLPLEDR